MKERATIHFRGKEVKNPVAQIILYLLLLGPLYLAFSPLFLVLHIVLFFPDLILKRCGREGFFKETLKATYDGLSRSRELNISRDAFKKIHKGA